MAKATYTIDDSAAISRIAGILAPLITNNVIDSVSDAVRWQTGGTNKVTKIALLLETGWNLVCQGRAPRQKLADVIITMTMEGYRRFLARQAEMKNEHVDEIVRAMRALKLDGSGLAARAWRVGLPKDQNRSETTPREATSPSRLTPRAVLPKSHHEIVREVHTLLSTSSSLTPQQRGKRLEHLVHVVLEAELLRPRGPIRNPGEELDRSFTIESVNYILECKWENEPVGFPSVRDFMGKVGRKAEGTFGVFLSMSGFVSNINTSAASGQRLNSIGLMGSQFMEVIEGHTTWTQLVESARRNASDRTEFHARTRV